MTGAALVYVIAGEPSGDLLGAGLMASLREKMGDGGVKFAGVGGPEMISQGLASLFPMSELSVMGAAEILPHIPHFLGRISQTAAHIKKLQPAVLVTIDSPGFCFRVARRLAGQGIPLVHYVAPSVWAWRPGRAAKVAGFLDHLLALLPFEPPYFEAEGLATTFIGHPVLEGGAGGGDGPAFRRRHGIDDKAIVLAVLPGSRNSETSRLLPIFGDTLSLLAADRPGLRIVVPTVPPLLDKVRAAAKNWPGGAIIVEGSEQKFDAFAAADVALAASGTVALELAMSGTPMVIAYKLHPISGWIAGKMLKTPYVNLINIILGRAAVPEMLQKNCRAALLAESLTELLGDGDKRDRQIEAGFEALDRLGRGKLSPSEQAAEVIITIINQQKGPT